MNKSKFEIDSMTINDIMEIMKEANIFHYTIIEYYGQYTIKIHCKKKYNIDLAQSSINNHPKRPITVFIKIYNNFSWYKNLFKKIKYKKIWAEL